MHLDHLPGSFFGPSNLVDLLRHRAAHQAQDWAFSYLVDGELEEIHWTYEELDRRARAIGAWLQTQGLVGERALLLYPPGLDFIAAFFGCLYAGVVAVPAYPPRRNRSLSRMQAIADDAEAKVALTTPDGARAGAAALGSSRPISKRCAGKPPTKCEAGLERDWRHPDVYGDTLAFLQYTSGSTGTPKGVVLNHANLMHNSALIAYAFEHTRSDRGMFWLPSYHDMGLIGGILQPLYIGQCDVLMSPVAFLQKPLRWLQAISRHKATISGGPNFAFDSVRPQDHRRAEGDARPEQLELGLQRRRAGSRGNDRPIRRGVCALRLPPRGVLSLLWHGRGDADRLGRLQDAPARDSHVRRPGVGKQSGRRCPAR